MSLPAVVLGLLATAGAGELEGEVGVDTLHAQSRSTEPASGPQQTLSATELGLRLRGELLELDDRLEAGIDYRGREALGGTFPTSTKRLMYRLDLAYEVIEDELTVGVGRFLAPSAVFLPLDGGRVVIGFDDATSVTVFGGRRGITSSRNTLGFDVNLPAAGLSVVRGTERYRAELVAAVAGDQVDLGTPESPFVDDYLAANGLARVWWRVHETVDVGAQASAAQRATYVIGSVAENPEIAIEALDLYNGLLWTAWRPSAPVRVQADVVHQEALVARAPLQDEDLVDPSFTDLRLRPSVRALDAAWMRVDTRLRLRPDRTELRYGGSIEADQLGVDGLFARGTVQIDDILYDTAGNDVGAVDRLLWRASGGWSGYGIDVEGGASFIDRAAGPVSGRVADPADPSLPSSSSDLNPFVLEAQNVLFVRGFASTRRWFIGGDLEANVEDLQDVRIFFQIGGLTEARW